MAPCRHRLEGVVYKRLASRYEADKRSKHWVKHKLRNTERLLVVGWQPADDDHLDRIYLARHVDGKLERVGFAEYGDGHARVSMRAALDTHARPRRRGIRAVAPGIYVDVAHHGQPRGVVRDAVIRAVDVQM